MLTIVVIANPIVIKVAKTIIAEHLKPTNEGYTLTAEDVLKNQNAPAIMIAHPITQFVIMVNAGTKQRMALIVPFVFMVKRMTQIPHSSMDVPTMTLLREGGALPRSTQISLILIGIGADMVNINSNHQS